MHLREPLRQVTDARCLQRVWSCWHPGRNAPAHKVAPLPSVMTVAFLVFCRRLPEMKARRPGRFALGLRTWTSVP